MDKKGTAVNPVSCECHSLFKKTFSDDGEYSTDLIYKNLEYKRVYYLISFFTAWKIAIYFINPSAEIIFSRILCINGYKKIIINIIKNKKGFLLIHCSCY